MSVLYAFSNKSLRITIMKTFLKKFSSSSIVSSVHNKLTLVGSQWIKFLFTLIGAKLPKWMYWSFHVAFLCIDRWIELSDSLRRDMSKKTNFSLIDSSQFAEEIEYINVRTICSLDTLSEEEQFLRVTLMHNGYPEKFFELHYRNKLIPDPSYEVPRKPIYLNMAFKGEWRSLQNQISLASHIPIGTTSTNTIH